MITFSCTSFSFPTLALASAARVVAAIGIPNVDLCIAEGNRDVDARRVEADPLAAAEADRRACRTAGLGIVDVFCHLGADATAKPVNTEDPDLRRANRARFAAYLRYASAVGATGLTLSPGVALHHLPDAGFGLACDELRRYVAMAQERGVRLRVEPHVGSIAEAPEAAARLVEHVGELRLTLDYSHFLAAGFQQEQVDALVPSAGHVHARQAAPGRLQVGRREGVLRFDRIVDLLRRSAFDGAISIEYVWNAWRDLDRVDVVSETVLLFRALTTLVERPPGAPERGDAR